MRYSAHHKEEARNRLVAAAGRGFRRRGFGGIGVDGLAKEAEVTSGAFYGHFPSKEAAFREVAVSGIEGLRANILKLRETRGADWIGDYIEFYMGTRRLCDLDESCAMQSLTPEVQRADAATKAAFEKPLAEVAKAIADGLPGESETGRLQRAWSVMALLSGGVTLARSVENPALAETIARSIANSAMAVAVAVGD